MVQGLKKCGITIMDDHNFNIYEHYCYNYNALVKKQDIVINLTIYAQPQLFHEIQKFILMLDTNIKILWLVRDPISRLKSSLNNSWGKSHIVENFSPNTDLSLLENRIYYHIDIHKSIHDRIKISIAQNTFGYANLYTFLSLHNFKNIAFLDMAAIDPSRAFSTFCRLALDFNFCPPHNPSDFNQIVHMQIFSGFLPLRYVIFDIEFYITPYKNIQYEVSELLSLNTQFFDYEFYVYVDCKYISNIQLNHLAIKRALQHFINKLKEAIEVENNNKTNEHKILQLVKNDVAQYEILWHIVSKEAYFVEKMRPDIVATWTYYQQLHTLYT